MNLYQQVLERAEDRARTYQQRQTEAAIAHYLKHPELARNNPDFAAIRSSQKWWKHAPLWKDDRGVREGRRGSRKHGLPLVRSTERKALTRLAVSSVGGVPVDDLPAAALTQAERWCYACRTYHPAAAFPPDTRTPDGLGFYCTGAAVVRCYACGDTYALPTSYKGRVSRFQCPTCASRSEKKNRQPPTCWRSGDAVIELGAD